MTLDLTLRSEKSSPLSFTEMDNNLQKLQDALNVVDGIKNLKVSGGLQHVKGFYVGSKIGGGEFYYDSSVSKAQHNGGTIIAPEAIVAWDGTAANIATLLNWTGSGSGCFVRLSVDTKCISATYFGALPESAGGSPNQDVCINKAIASFTFSVITLPAGTFVCSSPILMKPAVALHGTGAEATWIKRANNANYDAVIKAVYNDPGADYIYIEKLTVDGNKSGGGVGNGILFRQVHVPSYIQDVTVLNCTESNIKITRSTVVELNRVWSNRSDQHALEVDSVRSLFITGGAYEHSMGGTSHIKITNLENIHRPQVTISCGHIEGLMNDNMCGIEIGGGDQYYSVMGVNINGLQVLGKRSGGHLNNFAIKILNNECSIVLRGGSQTGCTGWITGARSTAQIPPVSAFSVLNWEYNGSPVSGYTMPATGLSTQQGFRFEVIKQQLLDINAYSQTEQNVNIPTQPDTDYSVYVMPQGYMGNNVTVFVDETTKTTTNFRVKFVDSTNGTAKQLANFTRLYAIVVRQTPVD